MTNTPMREELAWQARDLAVEIVDGTLGYTIEFSNSPSLHKAAYDVAAERIADFVLALLSERERAAAEQARAEPINMVLHCPSCGLQHVDAPDGDWTNPPHRSHLCHGCGTIWRPADVPTNGVSSIETRGGADNWPPALAQPAQGGADV